MNRQKNLKTVFTAMLTLAVLFTAQAKAATTFYEVWRNTEPNLATAELIIKWYPDNSIGEITVVDDDELKQNVDYYYWVRSFVGDTVSDYFEEGSSNGSIIFWYATEAKNSEISLSEKGWPHRCTLTYSLCGTNYDTLATFNTKVWESDDPLGGPLEDTLVSQWYTLHQSDQLCISLSPDSDHNGILETRHVDLYQLENGGINNEAEVFAKSIWSWQGIFLPKVLRTNVVNVNFINLEPPPSNFSSFGTPNGIRLSWNATPSKTTMFSQMVSARLPKTIYVDHSGTSSDPNGNSWETAYYFLQDALLEAEYGDKIYVAAPELNNKYYPDVNWTDPSGSDERVDTFTIPNGVKVYGGFPTHGGDPNQRDPDVYVTTLSGDIKVRGDINDNSFHVLSITNCDANTLLDGFVIELGFANMSEPKNKGAGIYIENSDAIIKNCIIASNAAVMASGIYCKQSSPAIVDCLIRNNYAAIFGGAGLYNENSDTTVINSKFMLNFCDINETGEGGDGGAIYNQASSPVMTNCEFKCNTAMRNGGGIYNWDSMPEYINCTFSGNIADVNGGGIFNDILFPGQVIIKSSVLWGNSDSNGMADEYSQIGGNLPVVYSSCIQDEIPSDGDVPFGGIFNKNIDFNPLFVNDPNPGPDGLWDGTDDCIGNLKLQYGSPCIEVGNNSYLPADSFDLDNDGDMNEPVSIDLADHLRLIDRDRDFIATVDMGAYERGVCPGNPDLDGSGLVNFADFAMFAARWLDDDCDCHGSCCDGADLDSNEEVNSDDLAILVNYWLSDPHVLFADDFEQGKSQEWIDILPKTWAENGWLYAEQDSSSSFKDSIAVVHDCDSIWRNYRLSVTVDPIEKWAMVCFRTNNSQKPTDGDGMAFDGYRLDICQGDGSYTNKLTLTRHQGEPTNTVFLKNSPENIVPGSPFRLDIEIINTEIKVYINDSIALEYSDDTPVYSGGIGLGCIWSKKQSMMMWL